MWRSYLLIAGLLVLAGLLGYLLATIVRQGGNAVPVQPQLVREVPYPEPAQTTNSELLSGLQQELQRARQAREDLESRLQALQLRVQKLERFDEAGVAIATPSAERTSQTETSGGVRTGVQALIDAGISEEQASWIQEQLDGIELQQLYLRDRATREGWLNEPRYHKERREFQNAVADLRDDVGDDAYDRLLYGIGRVNRVVVQDVLQHSAAAQYGLQAGDQIIDYDDQRIFSTNELSSLVTQGSAGVMTLVRVRREGEIHEIYLPRGPIGIRMSAARVKP